MGNPEWSNTRAGDWSRSEDDAPWHRSASSRYGIVDEPAEPTFYPAPIPAQRLPLDPDIDSDDEVSQRKDYWTPLAWTAAWCAVPLLVLLIRALILSGSADNACMAAGVGGCTAPRAEALADLVANSPQWALTLFAAFAIAAVLRWASDAWRAITIGFCSAIVAGGAMTVLVSIVN